MKYIIFLTLFFLTYINAYDKTQDSNNVYFSSDHFRVVAGISYKDSQDIQKKAYIYLDAAENTWQKEIVEFGFKQPKNSDKNTIDIYIGNKDASTKDGIDTTIASNFAGFAGAYPSDDAPFFVINPNISDAIVQITIAHEFFHTVQYAYYSFLTISNDDHFAQQIWWLEATAVLMEDEVYDDNNDYVNYLKTFFDASYKKIECYDTYYDFEYKNTLREYSMVIFAKFLKEKYGMEIIKDSFIAFKKDSDDFYDIFNSILQKDYDTNIKDAISEFAKWVSNAPKYFEEGNSYPALKHFKTTDNITIEKGGIEIVDNLEVGWNMVSLLGATLKDIDIPHTNYIWSYKDNSWENNITSSGYKQILDTNSSNGYWVKVDDTSFSYFTYYDNSNLDTTSLKPGWHLLGTTKKLSMDLFSDLQIVWQYKNNNWYVYSHNNMMSGKIENSNYKDYILDQILPYTAYWIYK